MKANEAPEKIYRNQIPHTGEVRVAYTELPMDRYCTSSVEYTRTDAFIEKACEYFAPHISDNSGGYDRARIIESFKRYMKK